MDLTADIIAQVVDSVINGVAPSTAAKAAGLPPRGYQKCETLARQGVAPYAHFVASVRQAEATFEAEMVKSIKQNGDWRAKFKLLESRFNDRWGQKLQVEVKQEVNRVLDACERVLPEELYAKVLEVVGAVGGEGAAKQAEPVIH